MTKPARKPATRTPRVDRLLAKVLYEYGGGGHRTINEVSNALDRGEPVLVSSIRSAIEQLDEYLVWPDGARLGGPLGGFINHKELKTIKKKLKELL